MHGLSLKPLSEAEICELACELAQPVVADRLQTDVLWLVIAMQDAPRVKVTHAVGNVAEDVQAQQLLVRRVQRAHDRAQERREVACMYMRTVIFRCVCVAEEPHHRGGNDVSKVCAADGEGATSS